MYYAQITNTLGNFKILRIVKFASWRSRKYCRANWYRRNTKIQGEQLETIDKHRSRAQEAKDLIQYFAEFNQGDWNRLENLRKDSNEGEFKVIGNL